MPNAPSYLIHGWFLNKQAIIFFFNSHLSASYTINFFFQIKHFQLQTWGRKLNVLRKASRTTTTLISLRVVVVGGISKVLPATIPTRRIEYGILMMGPESVRYAFSLVKANGGMSLLSAPLYKHKWVEVKINSRLWLLRDKARLRLRLLLRALGILRRGLCYTNLLPLPPYMVCMLSLPTMPA